MKWRMRFDPTVRRETAYSISSAHLPRSTSSGYISLQLYMSYHDVDDEHAPEPGCDIGIWAVVKLCFLKPKLTDPDTLELSPDSDKASKYSELYVKYLPANYHPSLISTKALNIRYETLVGIEEFVLLDYNFCSQAIFKNTVTVYCRVDICMLNQPLHRTVTVSSSVLNEPAFNLSETMEEARKNNLYTDVILVAGDKEFRAHRVILAAQSHFFRSRFKQRWQREDNKVEVSDLSSDILEAMITFMYTGKVPNIQTLAFQLLPAAEEYGLVNLRLLCERFLLTSLNIQNVIEYIVLADTHNANVLKAACISHITKNPSDVQKSEAWKQLKVSRVRDDLRMEILEAIAKLLIK